MLWKVTQYITSSSLLVPRGLGTSGRRSNVHAPGISDQPALATIWPSVINYLRLVDYLHGLKVANIERTQVETATRAGRLLEPVANFSMEKSLRDEVDRYSQRICQAGTGGLA
ncbi:hypothetical protein EVG20_g7084 [Dentipellis fragilis]|uniref:Uncharacterized protein n=1 Tax=Dentipellis fragilis TaxID=205917 RepID=A0A4Y9YFQ6_9AGAM|nr:hypothetical protein EVG20_g7084 [Dentipellis fragilis]